MNTARAAAGALAWLACAALLYLAAGSFALTLDDVTVWREGGLPYSSALPWRAPRAGAYVIRGRVMRLPWSHHVVRVVPEQGALQVFVNGNEVRPAATRLADRSVDLDVGSVLAPGRNTVELRVSTVPGPFAAVSLVENAGGADARAVLLAVASALCAAAALRVLLVAAGVAAPARALLCASLLAQLLYTSWTGPMDRGADVHDHLAYIGQLHFQRSLPAPTGCKLCFHPPPYYVVAAAIEEGTQALAVADSKRVLQLFSVALSMVFLTYAARTLALFLEPGLPLWVMVGFVSFFPSHVLLSPRIGNDAPLFALSAMAFFHLCRWWRSARDRRGRDYLAALLLGVAALNVKASGMIVVALLGVLHAVAAGTDIAAKRQPAPWWRREARRTAFALAVVALGFTLLFSRTLAEQVRGGTTPLGLGSGGTIEEAQRVGNGLANYVGFDLARYVSTPYASIYDDAAGRQQFLPMLLRMAMFGEYRVAHDWALPVARAMAVLLLAIFVWAGLGFLRALAPRRVDELLPASAGLVLFFAAMLFFRWSRPFASCNNWRLIAPVILPMSVLMGTFWQGLREDDRTRKAVDSVPTVLVALFAALSVVHWCLPAVLALRASG